jgi:integrase/recombinase XerD
MAKRKRKWQITLDKIVTDEEFGRIVAVLPAGGTEEERRELLVIWLLANTGLRVGEVCGLRLRDTPAYLGREFVHVHEGKGTKDRDVPVSQRFAAYIQRYVEEVRPGTMPQRYKKTDTRGWLLWKNRRKMSRQQVWRIVKKYRTQAKILKEIRPHSFRHRFATRMLQNDPKNLYVVKTLLGHSTVRTTEEYLHISGLLIRGIGDELDQMPQGFTSENVSAADSL